MATRSVFAPQSDSGVAWRSRLGVRARAGEGHATVRPCDRDSDSRFESGATRPSDSPSDSVRDAAARTALVESRFSGLDLRRLIPSGSVKFSPSRTRQFRASRAHDRKSEGGRDGGCPSERGAATGPETDLLASLVPLPPESRIPWRGGIGASSEVGRDMTQKESAGGSL